VTLRRDHVAGGAFVLIGMLVLAISADLPFGTLASPGAGMLPVIVVGLMMAFGVMLLMRAGESPPFGSIQWADFLHALRVVAVSAAAVAAYTWAGFLITATLLLFCLAYAVEGRHVVRAGLFSVGVAVLAYIVFGKLLKSPLPRGIFGF
jgi:hypothetical protein